jgi:hypothetical protein
VVYDCWCWYNLIFGSGVASVPRRAVPSEVRTYHPTRSLDHDYFVKCTKTSDRTLSRYYITI